MDELRMLLRLNEETQLHHAEADGDLDRFLFRANVTAEDYRTYLARVYGFVVPLEASLAMVPGLDELVDLRARAKAALVVHDLLALGMTMIEVNALPQAHVPQLGGPAAALGWMYVAERPLLASSVVQGHLATYLRAEMAYASAYLGCYAGRVGAMWRELGEIMDRVASSPAHGARLIASAHDAFRMLIRFRKAGSALAPVVRIAG